MGYDFGAFNDLIDLIDLIAGCSMLFDVVLCTAASSY